MSKVLHLFFLEAFPYDLRSNKVIKTYIFYHFQLSFIIPGFLLKNSYSFNLMFQCKCKLSRPFLTIQNTRRTNFDNWTGIDTSTMINNRARRIKSTIKKFHSKNVVSLQNLDWLVLDKLHSPNFQRIAYTFIS